MFTRITLCLIAALSLALGFTGDLSPVQQILRLGIGLAVLSEGLNFLISSKGRR